MEESVEKTMEEKIIIRNRRTAKGPLKPLIFLSLQVILLELISYILLNLFDTLTILSLGFVAVIQIGSFIVMIDGYKRVMARQKEQTPIMEHEETLPDVVAAPENITHS